MNSWDFILWDYSIMGPPNALTSVWYRYPMSTCIDDVEFLGSINGSRSSERPTLQNCVLPSFDRSESCRVSPFGIQVNRLLNSLGVFSMRLLSIVLYAHVFAEGTSCHRTAVGVWCLENNNGRKIGGSRKYLDIFETVGL